MKGYGRQNNQERDLVVEQKQNKTWVSRLCVMTSHGTRAKAIRTSHSITHCRPHMATQSMTAF